MQWFFAGERPERGDRGATTIGVLSANLEVGRIYLVRATAYDGAYVGVAQSIRDMSDDERCTRGGNDHSARTEFVDLIGVRPGGTEWNRALGVLRDGVRYEAAPRALEEHGIQAIVAQGRGRVGHCLDTERSRLTIEDGSPFWPLIPAEPSIEGVEL